MITPTNENVQPVGKRLLVEAYKQAKETSAGLEMVEGEGWATSVMGTVIRAGEGCSFKPGDVLLWRRYGIDSIKVYTEDGEVELYLLEESEVIGQINGSQETPDPYSQINLKHNASKRTTEGNDAQEEAPDAEK